MATMEHNGVLKYVDGDDNINILYPEIGKEITQAAYDALSEEEKESGTYWITDGVIEGDDDISGEVVDSLESTATDLALSANMGRVINEKLAKAIFIKSFDTATGTLETVSVDHID